MAGGVLTAQRPSDGHTPSLVKLPRLAPAIDNRRVHYASPYTSLPSLPDPGAPVKLRKLWGEDELTDRAIDVRRNGLTKVRTNFDNCNPDADVNYVLPWSKGVKLTEADIKFPLTPCIGRRVTRDPTFQIFPINDPNRTTGNGDVVLSDQTRDALNKLSVRLYRTSKNNQIYNSKARAMKMRIERDGQFAEEILKQRIGIYPLIANEGDCCTIPWSAPWWFAYYSTQHNKGASDDHFKTTYGCSFCRSDICSENGTASETTTVPKNSSVTDRGNFGQTEAYTNEAMSVEDEAKIRPTMDDFGPWENIAKVACCGIPEGESTVPCVHDYKRPCSSGGTYLCSDDQEDVAPDEHDDTVSRDPEGDTHAEDSHVRGLSNKWTNRDRDDLRRPCISKVTGMLNKSDAHKRFHMNHPDIIPDLRTFTRCLRRTQFFGYNSCVFRG